MKGKADLTFIVSEEMTPEQVEKMKVFMSVHKNVKVIVRPLGNLRTLEQNAYYWKIVIQKICDQFGWGKQDAHKFIKRNFLADRDTILDYCTWIDEDPIVFAMNLIEYVNDISTATLSEEEFADIMKEIRTFFSKAENGGIWIPAPGEADIPPLYS